MKIVSRTEDISPEQAKRYLEKNTHNRSVRESVVDRYAAMMQRDQWVVTHQGIAFDDEGNLLDGQHRLMAIVKAARPVSMMVTRGVPSERNNGITIPAMDVIDCGKSRTVADQLALCHGVKNSNLISSVCSAIAEICFRSRGGGISTAQALVILDIYARPIESAVEIISDFRPARKGSVIGALAFASVSHRTEIEKLMSDLNSGAELKKNQPALTLRDWLTRGNFNYGTATGSGRRRKLYLSECVLNAAFNEVHQTPISMIKSGENGQKFFCQKQRANVEKVRVLLSGK
jgi:hypothetical protein